MKNNKALIAIISILFTTALMACFTKKSCYDAALYEIHKNDICTEDWQGVMGCDGKEYANECHANRVGIRLK